MKKYGTITEIQKYSVHDGPGIRTVVFFKGCPLACRWCANPETHTADRSVLYTPAHCICCGKCRTVCQAGAISYDSKSVVIDDRVCVLCGACAEHCYAGALKLLGRRAAADEIMDVVMQDQVFYRHTGGGITLSGGEATRQADFALDLLRTSKERGITTALETCGYCSWAQLKPILRYTDYLLYDLKHLDPEVHRRYTGVNNQLILSNLDRASRLPLDLILRYPLIPGVNDDVDHVRRVGEMAIRTGAREVHILPFHQFGASKWENLRMEYVFKNVGEPGDQDVEARRTQLTGMGLAVNIGGGGEYRWLHGR